MKRALITGITGQDGSYLAELLLSKGYEVHGLIRRSSILNTGRIDGILPQLHMHCGDLTDSKSLEAAVNSAPFDEVYNLGAQSHVRASFDIPEYTGDVDGLGVLRLLEACRGRDIRFYQASTSELYGRVYEIPQTENTPFRPRSPYGIAKQYAYSTVLNYREGYNMFACNGILFNHESPRRGEAFVSRKISLAAARIKLGLQDKLFLGNLDAKRDWGYAPEYVEGMWRMLQNDTPGDYILATGSTYTVKDFLNIAFGILDLDWRKHVEIDPQYYRPTEVDVLVGDASKAKNVLGWEPKVKFNELVRLMVDAELSGVR